MGVFPFQSGKGLPDPTTKHQGKCLAYMFVMHVAEMLEVWPEAHERHRIWVRHSIASVMLQARNKQRFAKLAAQIALLTAALPCIPSLRLSALPPIMLRMYADVCVGEGFRVHVCVCVSQVPLVEAVQRCRHAWMRDALIAWTNRKGWQLPSDPNSTPSPQQQPASAHNSVGASMGEAQHRETFATAAAVAHTTGGPQQPQASCVSTSAPRGATVDVSTWHQNLLVSVHTGNKVCIHQTSCMLLLCSPCLLVIIAFAFVCSGK